VVTSINRFSDAFVGGNLNPLADWLNLSGRWKVTEPSSSGQSGIDDALTVSSQEQSMIVTKEKSFSGFAAEFRVIFPVKGTAGALFAYQNRRDYMSLLFSATGNEGRFKVTLAERANDIESLLAAREIELNSEQWVKVCIDTTSAGILSARADGETIFQMKTRSLPPGRFGFFAQDAEGAYFDDLMINTKGVVDIDLDRGK
jgi:hypothetical protein